MTLLAAQSLLFFFNDTATTEIYTLSLHDALPIYGQLSDAAGALDGRHAGDADQRQLSRFRRTRHRRSADLCGKDRKSTRLNSSHQIISYAVFCLKKKKRHTCVPPAAMIRVALHVI